MKAAESRTRGLDKGGVAETVVRWLITHLRLKREGKDKIDVHNRSAKLGITRLLRSRASQKFSFFA